MPRRLRPARRAVAVLTIAAVLGTLVAAAPPASATTFRMLTSECDGVAVKRCAFVWWTSTSNRIWGHIRIEDSSSDTRNYSVSVNRATVQYWSATGWRNLDVTKDYDGWHDRVDLVDTPYASCVPGRMYRVLYYAQWKRGSSVGGTWETTGVVTCPRPA